jgi:hypothetical protein
MEMAYCYDKAIPHSVFLTWSAEDRAKTLAYMGAEAEKCALCGTAPWEWEENRFAYEPEVHLCQGCYTKNSYNDSLGKTLPGTTVELVRSSPQRTAKAQIADEKRRRRAKE